MAVPSQFGVRCSSPVFRGSYSTAVNFFRPMTFRYYVSAWQQETRKLKKRRMTVMTRDTEKTEARRPGGKTASAPIQRLDEPHLFVCRYTMHAMYQQSRSEEHTSELQS